MDRGRGSGGRLRLFCCCRSVRSTRTPFSPSRSYPPPRVSAPDGRQHEQGCHHPHLPRTRPRPARLHVRPALVQSPRQELIFSLFLSPSPRIPLPLFPSRSLLVLAALHQHQTDYPPALGLQGSSSGTLCARRRTTCSVASWPFCARSGPRSFHPRSHLWPGRAYHFRSSRRPQESGTSSCWEGSSDLPSRASPRLPWPSLLSFVQL